MSRERVDAAFGPKPGRASWANHSTARAEGTIEKFAEDAGRLRGRWRWELARVLDYITANVQRHGGSETGVSALAQDGGSPQGRRMGAAKAVSRRGALGRLGAMATGPWILGAKARAANAGRLNLLMWSDYLPAAMLAAFEAETGIAVNHVGIGSNEEVIAKMKATHGRGFDLVSPTNMRSPQWAALDLLQPFDVTRLANAAHLNPAMRKVGETEWNFNGEGPHWLPLVWGTEGIGWRTDRWQPGREDGLPSYGDLWAPGVRGKTMMRPHSGMLAAGLHLEAVGQLPAGAMRAAYEDEAAMRATWQAVTAFCIANKQQLKLFWNDADTQKNGLLNEGVVLGQTWDGPLIKLMEAGEPVQYRAPAEGALAWVDGLALSRGAANVDAAYAFIDYCLRPEVAGRCIDGGEAGGWGGGHGYNSAVRGADRHASSRYARVFASVYPGSALANLWAWPREPQWYADARTEFRNQFVSA